MDICFIGFKVIEIFIAIWSSFVKISNKIYFNINTHSHKLTTIRKFRLARKLRQEDLAEKTDLTTNYIGMVERGEKIPSLETFIKIVNALGVSSDMVLTDVLETGYTVKNSMLNEKLEKLAPEDRNRIYEVIDTLVKQSKQILP